MYLVIKWSQILCSGSSSHFIERKLHAQMVDILPRVTYLVHSKAIIHKFSSLDSKLIPNYSSVPLSRSFKFPWSLPPESSVLCSICFHDFTKLHGYSENLLYYEGFFSCNFLMLCKICSDFHFFCITFVFPASIA